VKCVKLFRKKNRIRVSRSEEEERNKVEGIESNRVKLFREKKGKKG
jgi:hypothetical protein